MPPTTSKTTNHIVFFIGDTKTGVEGVAQTIECPSYDTRDKNQRG
jgi:hypothetical protein